MRSCSRRTAPTRASTATGRASRRPELALAAVLLLLLLPAPALGAGARRIKIVWTGLRRAKGKKLGASVVVPVTITDSQGKRTALRVRVRRG